MLLFASLRETLLTAVLSRTILEGRGSLDLLGPAVLELPWVGSLCYVRT